MEYQELNDGHKIPKIGYGTYKVKGQEGVQIIKQALDEGYRLLDTAAKYENEEAVGQAIKESTVDRKDIFVATKLWREQLGYEEAKSAFNTSLSKLGLDYIDLYLIHWPANAKNYDNWQKTNADTWRAMEELQAEGKIKSIGVSNFWPEHLDALLKTAKITPAVNQIEFHPGYWQPEVTTYCQQHGIEIESWSPLARGEVFENQLLCGLSKEYSKSVAQVCLRWIYQRGAIVIPKTSTPDRLQDNLDIFDFELSDNEITQINELSEMGFSGELPNEWPDKV